MAVQTWEELRGFGGVQPSLFHNHPKKPRTQKELGPARRHASFARALCSGPACDPRCWGFQFVFPTDRAEEVRATASKEGWLLSQRISLAWSASHEPIRDLWTWVKHAGHEHSPMEDVLLMQNPDDGSWAAWLKHRLSAFLKEN